MSVICYCGGFPKRRTLRTPQGISDSYQRIECEDLDKYLDNEWDKARRQKEVAQ